MEEEECVAGVSVEEKEESGWEDEVDSSIVIPSSEFAQEVEVETLEEDAEALFLLEESVGLSTTSEWVTRKESTRPLIPLIPDSWCKLKKAFLQVISIRI